MAISTSDNLTQGEQDDGGESNRSRFEDGGQGQTTMDVDKDDIFGGDLSDIEDDDHHSPQPDSPSEAEADDGDAYTPATLPSFKKSGKRSAAAQQGPAPKKRKSAKHPRPATDQPEPEPELDPLVQRKQRLDAILKASNKTKTKRKKKKGDADLDELMDEEIYKLRQEMQQAAAEDKEAIEQGRPASQKLRLLPRVVDMLQKPALVDSILDADILLVIRVWLEPLSNKALPALNIQRALFNALTKMDIETSYLKSSDLGKVVVFYTKSKRTNPDIKRIAEALIMNWMRPLVRRAASFKTRQIEKATEIPTAPTGRRRLESSVRPGFKAGAVVKDQAARGRHARIPDAISSAYTIAPKSRTAASEGSQPAAPSQRLKSLKQKLDASRSASKQI